MTHSLAVYHVLVNADVDEVEVVFVEERDDLVKPPRREGPG